MCSYPDPYLARTAVGQRTQLAKAVLDRVPDLFTSCFSDICADYRPIVEIYEIINVRGKGRSKVPVICYSSAVLKKFVEGFCTAFEKAAGVSASSFFGKEDFPSDFREGQHFKVSHLSLSLSMYARGCGCLRECVCVALMQVIPHLFLRFRQISLLQMNYFRAVITLRMVRERDIPMIILILLLFSFLHPVRRHLPRCTHPTHQDRK